MSPRRFPILFALAAALFTFAACGSGDDDTVDAGGSSGDAADGGATRPWIAGSWVLESATGDGGPLPLPIGVSVDLSITGPDRITGNAGCNRFDGRIDAPFDGDDDAGPLSITELSMTEMGCEHLNFEVAYLDLLARADRWELVAPTGLVLRGDGIELIYTIAEEPPQLALGGPTWIFDTIFDGEGVERTASSTRADKPEVTATFTTGTLTLISQGCTPLDLAVEAEADGNDGPFTVSDPEDLLDLIDCDDPESNLIAAVAGVAESTGYQVVDGRLTLIGLAGETVSFRAEDG